MLNKLTLTKTIQGLKNKKFSHRELYADVQKSIEQQNKDLNVYLTLNEKALDTA